jgi:hypothetical protein
MIYYEARSLFIHIPRTSGISVSLAVMNSEQDVEVAGPNIILGHGLGPFWRHSQASKIKDHLQEFHAPDFRKVAIIRNPWRICESMYFHFLANADKVRAGKYDWGKAEFRNLMLEFEQVPFSQFVTRHFAYLDLGFWPHWCLDWETNGDLGVVPYKFEDLDTRWSALMQDIGVDGATPRPRANRSIADHGTVTWTEEAVEFIAARCGYDFDTFGYPRNP